MEIQQLRVKITAEMSGLQKSLNAMKEGFKSARVDANKTEGNLTQMGNNAANSFKNATQALVDMTVKIREAGKSVQDFYRGIRAETDVKTGRQIINPSQINKEIEDARIKLKSFYEYADRLKAKISIETDPTALSNLFTQLDKANMSIVGIEDEISKLTNQLFGYDATATKAFTTPEIQELQEQIGTLVEKLKEAQAELANQRKIDFGSDEAAQAEQKVAELGNQYKQLLHQLVEMQEAANSGNVFTKLGYKVGEAAGKVVNFAKRIGESIKKLFTFKNAVKGIKTAFNGITTAMKKMNPVPKLLDKLGRGFKSLWSKIKTAFIFSVINSWFHNFKDRVSSYLKTNQELQSALGGLKGTFLTAFQPIYEAMIPAITALVNWLTKAIGELAKFISMLSGMSVSAMRSNAKSLYEQAKATEAAGGAAAEASKTIAAFDELNVLNGKNDSGGGGNSEEETISFPEIEEPEKYETWGEAFSSFLDKILEKLPAFNDMLSKVADKINGFSSNLLEMLTFPGVKEKVGAIATQLAEAFNNLWDRIDWNQSGKAIGAGIDLGLEFLVNYIRTRDWKKIGSSLAELLNGMFSEINWDNVGELLVSGWNIVWKTFSGFVSTLDFRQIGTAISHIFTSALTNLDIASFASSVSDTIKGLATLIAAFFEETDWKMVGETIIEKIKDFFANTDFTGIAQTIFEMLGAAIGALAQLGFTIAKAIWELIVQGWQAAKEYFADKIAECGGNVIEGILVGIWEAIKGIGQWIYNNILLPFIDGFKQAFGIHSPSTVMKEQGTYIIEGLLAGITETWQKIKQWITDAFNDLIKFCEDTWKSIKDTAKRIWDSIKTTITTIVDGLKKSITNIVNDINKKLTDIWNKIKTNIVKVVENIKERMVALWNNIKTSISTTVDNIKTNLTNKWNTIKQSVVDVATNIKDKVSEAFTNMKTAVVNIFEGIKNAIRTPINAIIGFINGLVGGVVDGLNAMIRAMNSLSFDVPDWVPLIGGQKFGFNIGYLSKPQIPLLANGGVITQPTMAMVGEYSGARSNPEIVAPQDILRDTVIAANGEMVNAIYQMAMQIISSIDNLNMEVSIGDDVIAQSAKRGADNYRRRTGRLMFV